MYLHSIPMVLFWPTVRINCSPSDREKLLKFEAEGREFAKFLRSLEQFIQTVKGQKYFLGFINLQEKLENVILYGLLLSPIFAFFCVKRQKLSAFPIGSMYCIRNALNCGKVRKYNKLDLKVS